jgi:hypothetical protein
VVGTALALTLLVAAGVADRRWAHVIGAGVAVAVAAALVAASRRVPTAENTKAAQNSGTSWMASAPVLLPAGAVLGWLGPAAVGEGLAAAVVVLLVARTVARGRSSGSANGGPRFVCLAVAAGVVVATAVAVAVGAGAGT